MNIDKFKIGKLLLEKGYFLKERTEAVTPTKVRYRIRQGPGFRFIGVS